jgi:hypothetical protein
VRLFRQNPMMMNAAVARRAAVRALPVRLRLPVPNAPALVTRSAVVA